MAAPPKSVAVAAIPNSIALMSAAEFSAALFCNRSRGGMPRQASHVQRRQITQKRGQDVCLHKERACNTMVETRAALRSAGRSKLQFGNVLLVRVRSYYARPEPLLAGRGGTAQP